jgi:uncharacterized protein YoxC
MLITILQVVLLISASVLCIFLILYLNNITKYVADVQKDVQDLSTQLKPLIESVTELSKSATDVSNRAQSQLDKTNWIIDQVKTRVEHIFSFEEKLTSSVNSQSGELIRNLMAFKDGLTAFWRTLRK